jgi:glutathione synthase/RimK-type ligase-like ATP-grasp enzyme
MQLASAIVLKLRTNGRHVAKIIVIVEKLKDWNSFYPVEQLMTPQDYLVNWDENLYEAKGGKERIKIINLCRNYKYLSNGYYCSLLAEARGHSVIPSVKAINDLSRSFLYSLETEDLDLEIQKAFKNHAPSEGFSITVHFGKTEKEQLQDVARQVFDLFPAPILHIDFHWDEKWEIHSIRTGSLNALSNTDEDKFASALDEYSGKIWRKPKAKKKYRYDMAILHNPTEAMPPSDKKALDKFIKAGKENDVLVELIEKKDYSRIAEFDALFIRETTALNHHTYRFAKKAEAEGLVVIDDPMSILRCTNKIYMHNLLQSNNINSPKTLVIGKDNPEHLKEAIEEIGLPMIIKIPDGAFSKGVYKVKTEEDLIKITDDLFKKTSLLLAQEYFYTDFDWRIGVFNDRAIYACKYYMTKGHWQIYNHASKKDKTGDSETFPISKVPKSVVNTALKLSHLVGDSLYGVDLKERDGKAYVIEINDNPNIDHNVEDAIAGMDLYHGMIHEFVRRIEEKK